jgi:diaminobutyrate-2-oxoglutarate transaminase
MAHEGGVFDRVESQVRSYCRAFPAVFESARGCLLRDETGVEYVDFFAGAGTLNYGHNNPQIKQAVVDYLQRDGVVHALDMWTVAKREFLEMFDTLILKPRGLDYKVQFTGPTGTNAVEAALKLARKVKRRSNVVAFTNGYHGVSLGALAVTGNRQFRGEAFVNRLDAAFMPYDGYFGPGVDTLHYLKRLLEDKSSGLDLPAAVIVETVQAEGGVNVARSEWLCGLAALCRSWDAALIVDDIQVGCGRTGSFFSFEDAGIQPDIVVLSKAIGGMGLPMSLLLVKPDIDQWSPGEHSGTFRGHNLAFVAATAALGYWKSGAFSEEVRRKGQVLSTLLSEIRDANPDVVRAVRGRGLIQGVEIKTPELAKAISREAFRRRLIIELAGAEDQVLKCLPPLVIDDDLLRQGVKIIRESICSAVAR